MSLIESETGAYSGQIEQLARNLSALEPGPLPEVLPPPSPQVPISEAASAATNEKLERMINRLQRLNKHEPAFASGLPSFNTEKVGSRIVTGLKCPRCNKRALRKARRVSFLDRIVALAMLTPYKCRYCQYAEWRFMIESLENSIRS